MPESNKKFQPDLQKSTKLKETAENKMSFWESFMNSRCTLVEIKHPTNPNLSRFNIC